MQVKVNEVTLNIFKGARVKDVVMQYSHEDYQLLLRGSKVVKNHHGHRLGLGGRVLENSELTLADR